VYLVGLSNNSTVVTVSLPLDSALIYIYLIYTHSSIRLLKNNKTIYLQLIEYIYVGHDKEDSQEEGERLHYYIISYDGFLRLFKPCLHSPLYYIIPVYNIIYNIYRAQAYEAYEIWSNEQLEVPLDGVLLLSLLYWTLGHPSPSTDTINSVATYCQRHIHTHKYIYIYIYIYINLK
jgi:hypothetical protein